MRKRTFFPQPSRGRMDGEFTTRERFGFTLKRALERKIGRGGAITRIRMNGN